MMVHFNDGNAFDTATGFRYIFERAKFREGKEYPPVMQVLFPGIGPYEERDCFHFAGDQALYLRECVIEAARADEQYLTGNLVIGELQARLRPARPPREMPKDTTVVDNTTGF